MRLTVYVKECCPLCDQALHVIEGVRRSTRFEYDVVDITTDSDLFERYRNLIPVVSYTGEDLFYGKVSAHRLESIVRRICGANSADSPLSPRYKQFLKRLRTMLVERHKFDEK